MAQSVIDSLVVTLGLDASKFSAGNRQARSDILVTKSAVGNAAGAMGTAFSSLAWKIGGLFLGFKGIEGAVDLMANTAEQMKQVGIASSNLGVAVNQLRSWQEATQLAGGSAQDMTTYLQGLNNALFSLRYAGQWSPLFTGLQRAGIPLTGPGGLSPDPLHLMHEIAGYLARTYPGTSPAARAWRTSAAEVQFGLPASLAYMVSDQRTLDAEWKKAFATNAGVTRRQTDSAARLVNSMIDLRFKTQDLAAKAFPGLEHAVSATTSAFRNLWSTIEKHLAEIAKKPGGTALLASAPAVGASGALAGTPFGLLAMAKALGVDLFGKIAPAFGIPSSVVGDVSRAMIGSDPASSLVHAAGVAASVPRGTLAFAGKEAEAGLMWLAASMAAILERLAAAVVPGGGVAPAGAASGLGAYSRGLAASVAGGTYGSFGASPVTIGTINITTRATDANAIARDIRGALNRKFTVTQADQGVRP